tara:strand:- start:428 stop:943 length:516 start_codon:yes stop_codon:yes gene_type:complete
MYTQFDYGVNGGISISSKDAVKIDNFENNIKGFYAGIYGEINLLVLYIRPEINIIRSSSKINSKEYLETNLEIPVSLGYKLFPLFSIYAGPSFTSNLNRNYNDLSLNKLNDKKNISFHVGTRFSFGPLSLNLTYNEGGNNTELSSNNLNLETGKIDKSNSFLKIGLSYSLD